jgi:hypothetical protein
MGVEILHQLVTARMPNGVEMIHMAAVGRDFGHHDILDLVEAGVVDFRSILARLDIAAAGRRRAPASVVRPISQA